MNDVIHFILAIVPTGAAHEIWRGLLISSEHELHQTGIKIGDGFLPLALQQSTEDILLTRIGRLWSAPTVSNEP